MNKSAICNSQFTDTTIGLIAGDGSLPLTFIYEASQHNISVIAIALTREISRNINKQGLAKKIHKIELGQIDTIIRTLQSENLNKVVLLGKVNKSVIFQGLKLDSRALTILKKITNHRDVSFMELTIRELESAGLEVVKQTEYLSSLLPGVGVLTNSKPSEHEWNDIRYGMRIAHEMAGMDIGQTIVIKNQTVVAVEALEGTDVTILRAGKFCGAGGVVVKASRPNQDLRYDIPTVGLNTLKTMKKSKCRVLAIEAGNTFIVDRQQLIKFADQNKMCIVAEEITDNS